MDGEIEVTFVSFTVTIILFCEDNKKGSNIKLIYCILRYKLLSLKNIRSHQFACHIFVKFKELHEKPT